MKINFKKGFTQVVDFGFVFENALKNINGLLSKFILGGGFKSKKTKTFSKPKFTTGFSIAEIVVVIGVMTLLTSLIYASLDSSKRQSRDQKKVAEISSVRLSLEEFYARNKYYPNTLNDSGLKKYLAGVPANIVYIPLNSIDVDGNMCGSYHLYTTLESRISAIDSKKGFDSTYLGTHCITGLSGIDASTEANKLVYDVTP